MYVKCSHLRYTKDLQETGQQTVWCRQCPKRFSTKC